MDDFAIQDLMDDLDALFEAVCNLECKEFVPADILDRLDLLLSRLDELQNRRMKYALEQCVLTPDLDKPTVAWILSTVPMHIGGLACTSEVFAQAAGNR